MEKIEMKKEFNIWEGIYNSFEDAAPISVGNGFASDIWIERTLSVANECLAALNTGKAIPFDHKQRSTILPAIVAMLLSKNDKVNILDFGGGLGIGYMTLAESIPGYSNRVKYNIVELSEVCEQGKKIDENINYLTALPLVGEFNLIHSASAFQYIDDWREFLSNLCSYNAPYILLSDVFAGSIPTFVTLQNYYENKIKFRFFNLDELVAHFSSLGYVLEMKTHVNSKRLDSVNVIPMDNFPESHRIDLTLHLLFCKSKED